MTTVLAFERHPVHPAAVGRFEAFLHDLLEGVRGAPGLLWADAARAVDDEPSFIILSEWRTAEDLDAWEASTAARELGERAEGWVRGRPTRRRFHSPSR